MCHSNFPRYNGVKVTLMTGVTIFQLNSDSTAQVQRECHELAAARLPKNRGMHGFIKCYEEALQQNFVVDQLVLGFFHERCKKQEAHKILEGTPEI